MDNSKSCRERFALLSAIVALTTSCSGPGDSASGTGGTTSGSTGGTPTGSDPINSGKSGIGGSSPGTTATSNIGGNSTTLSGGGGTSANGGTPSVSTTANAAGGMSTTGGSFMAGGASSAGGAFATGGTLPTGVTSAMGGNATTDGTMTTGGAQATGGSSSSGGFGTAGEPSAMGGSIATGGTITNGGLAATGGNATGGYAADGGETAFGGIGSTGGSTANGGGNNTGGTAGVAGCSMVLGYEDADGDGYGPMVPGMLEGGYECEPDPTPMCQGLGVATQRGDCSDGNPSVYPGAQELCNGVDDDCDGISDGLVTNCDTTQLCASGTCQPCATLGSTTTLVDPVVGNLLWCPTSVPTTVNISGNVRIAPNASITAGAGITFKFAAGATLSVYGRLEAIGTATNPVVFTGPNTKGSWVGIAAVQTGATVLLSNARVEYASTAIDGGTVNVAHSTISNNTTALGSNLEGSLFDCDIHDNDDVNSYQGDIRQSNIHNNGNIGFIVGRDLTIKDNTQLTLQLHLCRALVQGHVNKPTFSSISGRHLTIVGNTSGFFSGFDVHDSNVCANNTLPGVTQPYDVTNAYSSTIDASGNYWCTTDASEIAARIWDLADDPFLGPVVYSPFLTSPAPKAPSAPAYGIP